MNILIINQPPFNRGDESAHKGLLRALLTKIPNLHIKVLTPYRFIESARQYSINDKRVEYVIEPTGNYLKCDRFYWHGMMKNRTWLWHFHPIFWQYKKLYQWADIVVCAPGGICMGGFQDWDHLFRLKLAQFYKRPLVYYGRSFGPFPIDNEKSKRFKEISIEMLHYFDFLSIRDHKTELLANELGIKYITTVDSAFLDAPSTEIPYELLPMTHKPYMVFVPNYLLWHYAYKNRITHDTIINFYAKVIDEIWTNNPELNIIMLPQTFCESRYEFDDVRLFRDIAKKKNDKRIFVTANCYSSDIQQTIIKDAQYVIGGRYHSIVFAINQNVPCIALSYEHKISGLLETLNKSEWCIDFSHALDSMKEQEQCLTNIRRLIPLMKVDKDMQTNAKKIAENCMDNFINRIKNGQI